MHKEISQTWFESWLTSHIPKLMHHQKQFDNEKDMKIGDIILFLKHDGSFKNTYQYGMTENVTYSKDEHSKRF